MIAAGNIKAVGMENENWLKGYDPKNVTTAKDQIRKGEAFQNMMKQLDLSVDQEQNVLVEERRSVQLCHSACGGNPRLLLTAFGKEYRAQKEQVQAGPQQEKGLGEGKLAMGEDGAQKNNETVKPMQF